MPPASDELVRVVVADNDTDALDLVTLDLGFEGHEVLASVTGGEQAVELCRSLEPDVLVVDLRMPPGPDGLEVASRLHDQPGLRIVLYTNYRNSDVGRRAEALGVTYLMKGDLRGLRTAVAGD